MDIKKILLNEIMNYRKEHNGEFPKSIKITHWEEYELKRNCAPFEGPLDHIKNEFMGIKIIVTNSFKHRID